MCAWLVRFGVVKENGRANESSSSKWMGKYVGMGDGGDGHYRVCVCMQEIMGGFV